MTIADTWGWFLRYTPSLNWYYIYWASLILIGIWGIFDELSFRRDRERRQFEYDHPKEQQ